MSSIIKKYLKMISVFIVLVFSCQLFAPAFGADLIIGKYTGVDLSGMITLAALQASADPVLKKDLTKLPHKPYGYKSPVVATDDEKESNAKGAYFVVKAGQATPSQWGEIWCDIFYIEKGAKLKVTNYSYDSKTKTSTGGWLEIHAKVIRIDGEIDATGAGYLGIKGGKGGLGGDGGDGEAGPFVGELGPHHDGYRGKMGEWINGTDSENGKSHGIFTLGYVTDNSGPGGKYPDSDGGYGGWGAKGGSDGGYGKYGSLTAGYSPAIVEELFMGSGGQGGQGGGGGGGGAGGDAAFTANSLGGNGGKGGYGGSGGDGGRGGGRIKLIAKYSLIVNSTAKILCRGKEGQSGGTAPWGNDGKPGKAGTWAIGSAGAGGKGGIPGVNYGNGERGHSGGSGAGSGGGGGGAGGTGGSGGGGAGGGVLLKCYSLLETGLGIDSSIGTLGINIYPTATIDNLGVEGDDVYDFSKKNGGALKIISPSSGTALIQNRANVKYGIFYSYKLPQLEISSPAGGEYYSKNVPIKWIVKSGQAPLSGYGHVSYLNHKNEWVKIVEGINASKKGTGTKNWDWNWDSSNVPTSNNVQLKIQAADSSGNKGEVISRVFTVDNTKPGAPTKVTVGSPSVSFNGWTNENPKISWEGVKEEHSGLGKVQVAIQRKEKIGSNYKENLMLDKDLKFVGFDSVALAKWIDVYNLNSLSTDSTKTFYKGEFTMDASTWPIGIYHFRVRVIDRAGNISDFSMPSSKWSSIYNCDKLGPVMLLYDDLNKLFIPDILGPGRWINKNTFDLEATDDESGIYKYGYAVNDLTQNYKEKEFKTLTSKDITTITLPQGQSKLWFYAEDNLGNKNENWPLFIFPWWIRVDTKLPTIEVTGASPSNIIGTATDPGESSVPQTGSGINTIEAWLYTTDKASFTAGGFSAIQYWNGSSWVTGSQSTAKVITIKFDASGNWSIDTTAMNLKSNWEYRVVLKAIDKAGNESTQENTFTVSSAVSQASSAPGNLKISVVSNQIKLSWSAVLGATSYTVYRAANTPDFTKQTATFKKQSITGTSWTDPTVNIVGDANNNYFYFVTAKNAAGESNPSNRVGEFDFDLKYNSSNTSINGVSFVLDPAYVEGGSAINTAADLIKLIPNATAVSYFNAVSQKYVEYTKGMPSAFDFPVKVGYPYFVAVNKGGTWTMVGGVPTPPTFSLKYNAGSTSLNAISLKLNKANITNASSLMNAVPNCSAVSYFNADTQKPVEYPPIDNFATKIGYPYFVTVTKDGGF